MLLDAVLGCSVGLAGHSRGTPTPAPGRVGQLGLAAPAGLAVLQRVLQVLPGVVLQCSARARAWVPWRRQPRVACHPATAR